MEKKIFGLVLILLVLGVNSAFALSPQELYSSLQNGLTNVSLEMESLYQQMAKQIKENLHQMEQNECVWHFNFLGYGTIKNFLFFKQL